MGSFANTIFRLMLGWLQGIVSSVWSAFTSEKGGSFFTWLGKYWIPIAAILCIVGLVSDLGIYIVRWKPYKVWKSFFTRGKKEEEETVPARQPLPERHPAVHERPRPAVKRMPEPPAPVIPEEEQRGERPVISNRSEEKPAVQEPAALKETVYRRQAPATVTHAGYRVPEDSPYRRPKPAAEPAAPEKTLPEKPDEGKEQPVLYRRRRRINVSDLFSDPEEELHSFDAPQNVINSQKAYHEPVYPRGWKKEEDKKK